MSLLNIPHRPFPQVLSSPAGSLSRLSASWLSMGRSCREPPCAPAGVGCLAEWLTQLHTQPDGSQHGSQSEEEIRFCMLSESKVQNQRREVHQKEDAERGWSQGEVKNVQRKYLQRRGVNTHNRYQALSILETIREEEEEEAEEPIYHLTENDHRRDVVQILLNEQRNRNNRNFMPRRRRVSCHRFVWWTDGSRCHTCWSVGGCRKESRPNTCAVPADGTSLRPARSCACKIVADSARLPGSTIRPKCFSK